MGKSLKEAFLFAGPGLDLAPDSRRWPGPLAAGPPALRPRVPPTVQRGAQTRCSREGGLQLPASAAAGGPLHLLSGAAPGAWVLIIPLCGTPRLQPVNEAEE